MDKETLLSKFAPIVGKTDSVTGMVGDTGISGRTLSAYIDNILPQIDDDAKVDDAFVKMHADFLRTMGGQLRHEMSEFAKNYKPQEKTVEEQKSNQTNDELIKQITELRTSMEEMKQNNVKASEEKAHADMMKAVKDAMKRRNATDAYVLEKTMQGVRLDMKKTVEQLTEEHLKRYDSEYKACRGEGVAPRTANGTGGGKTYADDFFARKKAKEGWGAKPQPKA